MNAALLGTCIALMIVQFLACVPWASTLGVLPRDPMGRGLVGIIMHMAKVPWATVPTREQRASQFWLYGFGLSAIFGLLLGFYLNSNNDPRVLANWGRFYFSILHLQLGMDFFVVVFLLMLQFWPKGGAVALAAFQEGLRQPKYWLLLVAGAFLMAVSTIIPFFTFGEDIKVVKELSFVSTMLLPGIFGLLAASISVAEEIEGRTAVTLMSKPIQRRDFLVGKFVGIALAALTMTILLGWWLVWIVLYKEYMDPQIGAPEVPDPTWISEFRLHFGQGSVSDLVRGMCLWISDAGEALPGLTIGFCQVMVITALAVALATRVPMIVNVVACFVVYFLGHLTTILTEVTAGGNALISFLAQLFDTILPGLDLFDVGPAIVRDNPVPPMDYAIYAAHVTLYGLTFTAIALLLGLILFEDRDLA
jgi:hypothetical protein